MSGDECPKCNGKGLFVSDKPELYFETCDFCYGKKELNWIEVIFGAYKSHSSLIEKLLSGEDDENIK
jgi:hypothetical protein